ncbi:hypothetical protein LS68_003065 [Helicobacter sp. MIT 05-5293]|uniref:hypothetical protein n=1 Tax=Helicobacter sp. MIT 05-5293 TaxID=1548149 RepID=UPI0010FE6B00|nr:hypothetical protein [Helicobacter sp. MIT 05-5293]TLD82004.1 hypothetical protein LS68_003065 [Helicobacter sp. MIT 05-5293]
MPSLKTSLKKCLGTALIEDKTPSSTKYTLKILHIPLFSKIIASLPASSDYFSYEGTYTGGGDKKRIQNLQ